MGTWLDYQRKHQQKGPERIPEICEKAKRKDEDNMG